MNLYGLVSFYDEQPDVLAACIDGLAKNGVDHIIALDGAYALYPDAAPCSPPEQHAAIFVACRRAGIGLTLHIPDTHWIGNEVEKRSFHFALANGVAKPGDWFWIMDADQVVIRAPLMKQRLAETTTDVASTLLHDTVIARIPEDQRPADLLPDFMLRNVFRAQPLTVVQNHYTFVTDDGRILWGGQGAEELEPCLELTDVFVEHRPDHRTQERQYAKQRYYHDRDESAVEMGPCMRCPVPAPRAARKVPVDLRVIENRGKRMAAGTWIECCVKCAKRAEYENRWRLRDLGFDPDSGQFENRNGQMPAAVAA